MPALRRALAKVTFDAEGADVENLLDAHLVRPGMHLCLCLCCAGLAPAQTELLCLCRTRGDRRGRVRTPSCSPRGERPSLCTCTHEHTEVESFVALLRQRVCRYRDILRHARALSWADEQGNSWWVSLSQSRARRCTC